MPCCLNLDKKLRFAVHMAHRVPRSPRKAIAATLKRDSEPKVRRTQGGLATSMVSETAGASHKPAKEVPLSPDLPKSRFQQIEHVLGRTSVYKTLCSIQQP